MMSIVLLLRIESVMLNKTAKVIAASPIWSPNHYEVKHATIFLENMKLTDDEMFASTKHCVGASASSVAAIIPSKEHHKVLLSTARSREKEKDVQSSCVADNEPHIDDIVDNISTGLSMITREAQSYGTIVDVSEQRSNINQFECKIKDKICKLIIDGDSFTNAISLDLMHSLSLSMRKLPTPRYMQWVNQSGTKKICTQGESKFSVGNYVDSVDCDVAPMSACHLGWPWQFNVDATHGGHFNSYSFVHKCLPYVLKPMEASAIKDESFPILSTKKHIPTLNPKSRMILHGYI
jgi:hypothetical protein